MNRSGVLATVLFVFAMTGPARGEAAGGDAARKPHPDVGAGRVAWFDITTTSMAKSKEFYGKLFDWQFTGLQGTEYAVEIVAGGTPIGTLRVAEGAIGAFNGVPYVQVEDMQAACKKVRDLGGKIIEGFPFNLTNRTGAVGLFLDPVGHPMGMYSRTPLPSPPAAK
jgi:predicted enzyme related to lactoylglutathione lyase